MSVVRLVAVLAVAVALGGCDDSGEDYGTVPRPSSAASPSVAASPSASLDPARQEVVDRYLLYVRTLEKLYETTDPAKVDMAAVATGAQFRKTVEIAIQLKARGQYSRGVLVDHIFIDKVKVHGMRATLVSCQDANGLRVFDRKTSQPVNPGEKFPKRIQSVNLKLESDLWKVDDVRNSGEC